MQWLLNLTSLKCVLGGTNVQNGRKRGIGNRSILEHFDRYKFYLTKILRSLRKSNQNLLKTKSAAAIDQNTVENTVFWDYLENDEAQFSECCSINKVHKIPSLCKKPHLKSTFPCRDMKLPWIFVPPPQVVTSDCFGRWLIKKCFRPIRVAKFLKKKRVLCSVIFYLK